MNLSKRVWKVIVQMALVVVALLLVDMLNTIFHGDSGGKGDISFTDRQITFSDASGGEVVIPYADVISLVLLEAPDYGEPLEGCLRDNLRLGTWESGELGVYIAHTDTGIGNCLCIETVDHTYAINYESDETTALLVDELNKYR